MTEHVCLICGLSFETMRGLSTHLQVAHGLTSEQYTVDCLGANPTCSFPGCGNKTRYVSFSFKKFCKQHGKEAMRVGGREGGKKKESWNKGKTKFEDDRILKQSIDMSGQGNHFFGKTHKKETVETISSKKRLSKSDIEARFILRKDDFTFPSFSYEDYQSRQHQKIECRCVKCGTISKKTLQALERGSLCSRCYPFIVSRGELEMGDFIQDCLHASPTSNSHEVLRNSRDIISPLELDIYIPDLSLAFEYHGVYWHMDRGHKGFDKYSHKTKHELCKAKGIKLVQFFSTDWENKQELVKSMIRSRLGVSSRKMGARRLDIDKDVHRSEAKQFFELNHLGGHVKASKYIGLRDKETQELVQVISLRDAFHKKYKDCVEIARFATSQNTQVAGGFSKLMKEVLKYADQLKRKKILSYVDLLHGTGKVYESFGFEYIGDTGLNYWYTDGRAFFNRFSFRATQTQTEEQVAKNASVSRIYGAGNSIYCLERSSGNENHKKTVREAC